MLLSPALSFSLSSRSDSGTSSDNLDVAKRYMNRACSRCMHTGAWSSCSACRLGPVPYYGIGKRSFFPVDTWESKRAAKRGILPEESVQGDTSSFFPESNWGSVYKRAEDSDEKRSFFPQDKWDAKRTFFPVERFNRPWNVKRSFFPTDNWEAKRSFFPEHSWRYKREDTNSIELKMCQACCSPDSFSPRCCYFCQMK